MLDKVQRVTDTVLLIHIFCHVIDATNAYIWEEFLFEQVGLGISTGDDRELEPLVTDSMKSAWRASLERRVIRGDRRRQDSFRRKEGKRKKEARRAKAIRLRKKNNVELGIYDPEHEGEAYKLVIQEEKKRRARRRFWQCTSCLQYVNNHNAATCPYDRKRKKPSTEDSSKISSKKSKLG